ncbi:MAG: bifunctional oligoribonuclease/PAP phosphatase NrnA [Spirochaetales bacterium]|nr:bifunctional oligoribonuclease/PAP phosphatase NrnA [Spirochaetales bacterium]
MNNMQIKQAVLDLIREYDSIIISRHIRPDGDACGSALGLKRIIELSFPDKTVRYIADDESELYSFLGSGDQQVSEEVYRRSLLIVVDTATDDRISNSMARFAGKILKIDHHIDNEPYGDLCWIEDGRSSNCELLADFLTSFPGVLKTDTYGATCLYAGMVTDSGRFMFEGTCGDTLRLAGALLDYGVDIQTLYAQLYMDDYAFHKFKAHVLQTMNITPSGVAWTYVDNDTIKQFGLSLKQASECASFMEKIRGSLIWLAFIDNPDGTIRVRLRSRFVTVNSLANKYGGGGHANASGATVADRAQMQALIDDADALLADYKANHRGWL